MNTRKSKVMKLAHKRFTLLKKGLIIIHDNQLVNLWRTALKWAWKAVTKEGLINLWSDSIQEMILNGTIELKPLDQVVCGSGKPSTFISTNGVTIECVHWQGTKQATESRILKRLSSLQNMLKRDQDRLRKVKVSI